VTTHVLDTARGRPAAGVPVRLEQVSGPGATGTAATEIAATATDSDGRASSLGPDRLPPGIYRLVFDTAAYLGDWGPDADLGPGEDAGGRNSASQPEAFFPEVAVTFRIDGVTPHYHVPLLLSPFGYSTYRGS
jgi:5-hydroxyisourate hydrolase